MDIKDIFLILSTIVSFSGYFIGIYSIFKGEYKPHRTTRLIILIVISISALSLFLSGDRVGLFLALAQTIGCLIIFLLSLKFGMGGMSRVDIIVLIFAIITLIIWKTTNNPILALYMSITTDFIGFSPTLYKAFKLPFTEDPKFYSADIIAGLLNLLALRLYNFSDIAFPGYIFIVNLACVILIIVGRLKTKRNNNV